MVSVVIVGTLLKVLGGFAAGFVARDLVQKRHPKQSAPASKAKQRAAIPRPREELKMVLCVNEGLKMGKGKIGAQCAHAAVGVVQKYSHREPVVFKQWECYGQPKIALRIQDDVEMDELADRAVAAGLPVYIVCDAGRTQIPAGSQTVLAVGPGPKSAIDKITGHLKLL